MSKEEFALRNNELNKKLEILKSKWQIQSHRAQIALKKQERLANIIEFLNQRFFITSCFSDNIIENIIEKVVINADKTIDVTINANSVRMYPTLNSDFLAKLINIYCAFVV